MNSFHAATDEHLGFKSGEKMTFKNYVSDRRKCVARSPKRRYYDNYMEESSLNDWTLKRSKNLKAARLQTKSYLRYSHELIDAMTKEVELQSCKKVCKICENIGIQSVHLLDHSRKCKKIHEMKSTLKNINKWLIKECKYAQNLKNNIGFDLLIAKNVFRGSESYLQRMSHQGSSQPDEHVGKKETDFQHQNKIDEEKTLVVAKELSRKKYFATKVRRCITSDFINLSKKRSEPAPEQKTNDNSGDAKQDGTIGHNRNRTIGSHGEDLMKASSFSSNNSEECRSVAKTEPGTLIDRLFSKKLPGPSWFRGKYKPPSGQHEFKQSMDSKKSGQREDDFNSQLNIENKNQGVNPQERDKEDEEDCVGDRFFGQEREWPNDSEAVEELEAKQSKNNSLVIQPRGETEFELVDPPTAIDDLLSEENTSAKKVSEKEQSQNSPEILREPSHNEEKEENIESGNIFFPFAQLRSRENSFKNSFRSGKLIRRRVDNVKTQNAIENNFEQNTETQNLPEAAQTLATGKSFQLKDFKELSKSRGFSTQINIARTSDDKSVESINLSRKDLARDIKMAKVCSEFFDKMGQ